MEHSYITAQPPTASIPDIQTLLSLPPPNATVVNDLIDFLQSEGHHKAFSLACPQVGSALYPLWMITYWISQNHILKSHQMWMLTHHHLQKLRQGSSEASEVVDEVYLALSQLPWSGNVKGFSEEEEITHLHKYGTTTWLSTTHENQMLDLLQQDLLEHQYDRDMVKIVSTYFVQALFNRSSHKKHDWGWVKRVRETFARGGAEISCNNNQFLSDTLGCRHPRFQFIHNLVWQLIRVGNGYAGQERSRRINVIKTVV
jgi:hypothetical protein